MDDYISKIERLANDDRELSKLEQKVRKSSRRGVLKAEMSQLLNKKELSEGEVIDKDIQDILQLKRK
jgi:hypothetical protein